MKLGAFDFLQKPLDSERLVLTVEKATEAGRLQREALLFRRARALQGQTRPMVGESPAMRVLEDQIARLAATDTTVLIVGESGTGKELVARALHEGSVARGPPLRRRRLRRARRQPARVRALRPHPRRLHRRRRGAPRPARGGAPRHAAPRRDRQPAARSAGAPPARPAGAARAPARRQPGARDRRARGRRHQPRSGALGRRGALSPGPVLSPRGGHARGAAACASGRATFRCWCGTSRRRSACASAGPRSPSRPRCCATSSAIHGRATCASCRTRSSARSSSPPTVSFVARRCRRCCRASGGVEPLDAAVTRAEVEAIRRALRASPFARGGGAAARHQPARALRQARPLPPRRVNARVTSHLCKLAAQLCSQPHSHPRQRPRISHCKYADTPVLWFGAAQDGTGLL